MDCIFQKVRKSNFATEPWLLVNGINFIVRGTWGLEREISSSEDYKIIFKIDSTKLSELQGKCRERFGNDYEPRPASDYYMLNNYNTVFKVTN